MKLPPLELLVMAQIARGADPWKLSPRSTHRAVTAAVNRIEGKDFVRRIGDYGRTYTVTDRGRAALGSKAPR